MPDNLADSNNAAPVPVSPAAAVMGVPPPPNINQSQVALANRNMPADPNQVQNPDAQHSALGRGLLHIAHAIEGKQVDYVPQSDGTVQPVVSQRKPGGLFRDMVLGAIAGNVAASTTPTKPGSGGLSGFGIGAQAGLRSTAQAQQQRQDAATGQAKQKQQLNQDNLAAATVASDTASSVNLGHFIGHHDPKEIGALNNSVGIIKNEALNAGGQMAQIPGIENGKQGNGPSIMAAINRDPSLMQGPADYHRIPLITYGTDGMSHDGKSWNSGDGNDVNWNDRATVTLVDLPNAAWNKQVTMTKADVNRIAGYPIVKGKDTDSVQTTFGSLFSLGLQSKKQLADTRTERLRGPKDENEALQWKSSLQGIDPQSSDYTLAKSRADKADTFLDAQSDQKNAGKTAPLVDSVPKAQAALSAAKLALQAKPNDPALQQAAKNAQQQYNDQVASETHVAAKKKSDELQAQRAIENGDLGAAAKNIVNDNLAQLKDIASFRGDQKIRLYDMIATEAKAAGKDPKDYSPSALAAKTKVLNDFDDGKAADNIMAFNTFLGHANDALSSTAAMRGTSGSPLINKPLNWLRKNAADDTHFTAFQTALVPVRKEYMNFLNNNRAEHEDDLKVMNTVLSDNSSPAQIEAAIKKLGQSADIRLRQLGRKYSNTMKSEYPNLIAPEGQEALQRMGIKSSLTGQGQPTQRGATAVPNGNPSQQQGNQGGWGAQFGGVQR
jgi:hypothetical protein